jgi:hypothetical protein
MRTSIVGVNHQQKVAATWRTADVDAVVPGDSWRLGTMVLEWQMGFSVR